MKGIRSLFRLGALAMIAVLLVVALTVPAAAADETCDDEQMLDEVVILAVSPLESAYTWSSSELLSYGDGAADTYKTGQLEVQFNDINTAYKITHYDVIATPSDEPGVSAELGVEEVVSSVDRPSVVGSTVTATLDLEPGTNYDIDVVANFYSVQTSPNQSNQDSLGATTFLSPPFLGGGVDLSASDLASPSPADRGVHYLVYKSDQELHTLSWLNPAKFGPFDHVFNVPVGHPDADPAGADILCTNNDGGDLTDDCTSDDGVGITHYRVTVTDDNGNTEYVETIEVSTADVYSTRFNLNDGTYTFAVDAGYVDGGKFYALSDKSQVEFDIPDDYRKFNQDVAEIDALVDEILDTVNGEEDDFDPFYDSDWNYAQLHENSIVVAAVGTGGANPTTDEIAAAALADKERALTVYLNNLYN